MAAKSQPKKSKATPKKKTSKSAPKKAAAAKKSASPKKSTKQTAAKKPTPPKKAKPVKAKAPKGKAIALAEFVSMTYLTENGAIEWLKQGRLTGSQDGSGQWMIDAANLEVPDIKRLVR